MIYVVQKIPVCRPYALYTVHYMICMSCINNEHIMNGSMLDTEHRAMDDVNSLALHVISPQNDAGHFIFCIT